MDYLAVIKVPIHPTSLILVGVISPIAAFLLWGLLNTPAGLVGLFGLLLLQLWFFNYCFELIERIANGIFDPPVLDTQMLSPFESRPWIQLALLAGGGALCWWIGGGAGVLLGIVLVLWIPASLAILGAGQNARETLNPLTVFRLVRGLGPHYLVMLAAMAGGVGLGLALIAVTLPMIVKVVLLLLYEIAFSAVIGGAVYVRRAQIGYVPSRSPERTEAREEAEREKARAKMLDDVFTNVRVGKHVDATAPLAAWLRDADAEQAIRDSYHVAEKALSWGNLAALNTIGSTLIRNLLRFGRPDAALAVFERLRGKSQQFTMDSAPDLRTLADHAESTGREELAASMRLETPVFHPPR
ncbi:MAG: hypothetical protein H7Y89_07745 [Steroidobacteraceae bacterium]|nr:hypothetical protein [Steroidobacteraceae bacterium]